MSLLQLSLSFYLFSSCLKFFTLVNLPLWLVYLFMLLRLFTIFLTPYFPLGPQANIQFFVQFFMNFLLLQVRLLQLKCLLCLVGLFVQYYFRSYFYPFIILELKFEFISRNVKTIRIFFYQFQNLSSFKALLWLWVELDDILLERSSFFCFSLNCFEKK